jgi:dCMP deaminase
MNAITQAANHGANVKGATAYITNMSCTTCAKALIAAGVERVVVFSDFHDTLATQFYTKCGVEIVKKPMPDRMINYDIENYSSAKKTAKSK